MMNYNHLYYFYMVVREGSVTAAARKLNISQPSLSAQIKTLELSLGKSLFERRGNHLDLTSDGRATHAIVSQMFELSAAIPKIMSDIDHRIKINIGVAEEIERPFAVNFVKKLFQKWNQKKSPVISFTTGANDVLMSGLRSWSTDAVFTNRPNSFEDLEIAGSLVMPVFLAVGTGGGVRGQCTFHCSTREIPGTLNSLNIGLAVPSTRLKLREEIDDFFSRARQSHSIVFESDTLATIIRAVIDGVGAGFLPLPYIIRQVQKKEIAILGPPDGLWKHTLFLVVKRGQSGAPGLAETFTAFTDLCREQNAFIDSLKLKTNFHPFIKMRNSRN